MCIIRSCVASVVVLRTTRSNETLTEPNYVLQEYETTKSENGYSIVNDFMVYDEPSPSGLYVYYPYVEEKKKV